MPDWDENEFNFLSVRLDPSARDVLFRSRVATRVGSPLTSSINKFLLPPMLRNKRRNKHLRELIWKNRGRSIHYFRELFLAFFSLFFCPGPVLTKSFLASIYSYQISNPCEPLISAENFFIVSGPGIQKSLDYF